MRSLISPASVPAVPDEPFPAGRFLSRPECAELLSRAESLATGGGHTELVLESRWEANLRWARNQVISSGDIRRNAVRLTRDIRGALGLAATNQLSEPHLREAVRIAERFLAQTAERPEAERATRFLEPYAEPKIWSDATYKQTADARAELMARLVEPARKAGLVSAGYVQVSAHGRSSMEGETRWYYPYTCAQISVTVRAPDGSGSGWAGIDHYDWGKIDPEAIANTALDKCLKSRNPVRLEPGRYTTILEPQAVCDMCALTFGPTRFGLSRWAAEHNMSPFSMRAGLSLLGQRVTDERLTVGIDPTDPECAFPPFYDWEVFRPITWIGDGVLKELDYDHDYAVTSLGRNTGGMRGMGSFRMSGKGPATGMPIEEMIATTKRGILVTRLWGMGTPQDKDTAPAIVTGYTRDGLWLIEDGKISKAIKNFRFTESPLLALNRVEQVGVPTRVFHPTAANAGLDELGYAPVVVPALKIRDFNFVALTDAV